MHALHCHYDIRQRDVMHQELKLGGFSLYSFFLGFLYKLISSDLGQNRNFCSIWKLVGNCMPLLESYAQDLHIILKIIGPLSLGGKIIVMATHNIIKL